MIEMNHYYTSSKSEVFLRMRFCRNSDLKYDHHYCLFNSIANATQIAHKTVRDVCITAIYFAHEYHNADDQPTEVMRVVLVKVNKFNKQKEAITFAKKQVVLKRMAARSLAQRVNSSASRCLSTQ